MKKGKQACKSSNRRETNPLGDFSISNRENNFSFNIYNVYINKLEVNHLKYNLSLICNINCEFIRMQCWVAIKITKWPLHGHCHNTYTHIFEILFPGLFA